MGIRLARGALLLVSLLAVAAGGASAGTSAKVTVASGKVTGLGAVLVSAGGLTLYHTTSEGNGSIACTNACARTWPPLLLTGAAKPVAGSGLAARKLGTVKRPDGRIQVTYNGYALYRYAADTKVGDAKGQGAAGAWYAINPSSGKILKASLTPTGTAGNAGTAPLVAGGGGGEMNSYYPSGIMDNGAGG